jgi:hypothetical protein
MTRAELETLWDGSGRQEIGVVLANGTPRTGLLVRVRSEFSQGLVRLFDDGPPHWFYPRQLHVSFDAAVFEIERLDRMKDIAEAINV